MAYDRIHDLIVGEKFNVIDDFLHTITVKMQTSAVLLSILTITALSKVRERLIERDRFYQRVNTVLKEREGDEGAAELLFGLEFVRFSA